MTGLAAASRRLAAGASAAFALLVGYALPQNARYVASQGYSIVMACGAGVLMVGLLGFLSFRILKGSTLSAIIVTFLLYCSLLGRFLGHPVKMGVPRQVLCAVMTVGLAGMVTARVMKGKHRDEHPPPA